MPTQKNKSPGELSGRIRTESSDSLQGTSTVVVFKFLCDIVGSNKTPPSRNGGWSRFPQSTRAIMP